jgi:molybdopterin-guanine dinucleotide biosynthesis protein
MQSILEILGPSQSGKTTFTEALIQGLESEQWGQHHVLVIDADLNGQVSQHLSARLNQLETRDITLPEERKTITDKTTSNTLSDLVKEFQEKPTLSNEAIEWRLQDLMETINPKVDLLRVGAFPAEVSTGIEKMLLYGLKRLIQHYDVLLLDGDSPFLRNRLLASLSVPFQSLILCTMTQWDASYFHPEKLNIPSPNWIANQCPPEVIQGRITGVLGEALDEALDDGRIRLIAKIPLFSNPKEELQTQLPSLIQNALLKIDLPFVQSVGR